MSETEYKDVFARHAPSAMKFFYRFGLVLLVFCLGGVFYGQTMLSVPAELTAEQEYQFKIGMGLWMGVVSSVAPLGVLVANYIFMLFRAKKATEKELFRIATDRMKKGK